MSSFPLVLTNPINEGQETSDPKSAKCKPGWLKILHDFKINPALPQAFYPHAYKAAVKYRNDFPNHFCKEIYGSRSNNECCGSPNNTRCRNLCILHHCQ